jgi:hypothetical protein
MLFLNFIVKILELAVQNSNISMVNCRKMMKEVHTIWNNVMVLELEEETYAFDMAMPYYA